MVEYEDADLRGSRFDDVEQARGFAPEQLHDRMTTVRHVVDGLTPESLAADTEAVEGPGWPPPESFPVSECLLTVLNEEYLHRLFAERDLDAIEARGG
jgi:hypothetical protein